MKLYLKYRNSHWNLWQWDYTISYLYNQDRPWYVENWVNIQDSLIQDYKLESKWKKFAVVEFDETKVSYEDLKYDLELYKQFATVVLTNDQAKQFIRDNTNLQEVDWKFLLQPERINMEWQTLPPMYLEI